MELSLSEYGFIEVKSVKGKIPECVCLLKKQTFNINRAVCVVELAELPEDFSTYIHKLRTKVAFQTGFIPVFWGLGLQVVVICPQIASSGLDPNKYVAKFDNQWAIIQSVFLADNKAMSFIEGRTWGQVITGQYQDSINEQLAKKYAQISI